MSKRLLDPQKRGGERNVGCSLLIEIPLPGMLHSVDAFLAVGVYNPVSGARLAVGGRDAGSESLHILLRGMVQIVEG